MSGISPARSSKGSRSVCATVSISCWRPASRGRRRIRASGGGIASPLWRSILADVLEAEIATVSTTEGAAYWGCTTGRGRSRLVRRCRDGDDDARPGHPGRRAGSRRRGLPGCPRALPGAVSRPCADLRSSQRLAGRSVSAGRIGQPRSSISALSFSVTSPGFLPRMIIPRMSSGVSEPLSTVSTMRPWYITLTRSDRSKTSWMS